MIVTHNMKLVGQNYTTPDLIAKVTGSAKFAEDYRVEGMLFAKLLLSRMPHARVRRLDLTAALAVPGVRAILTADDVPGAADTVTDLGKTIKADIRSERALTNEPMYCGEPVPTANSSPLKPSRRSRLIGSSCRSTSIRSTRSGRAGPTRAVMATCGHQARQPRTRRLRLRT